MEIHRKAARSRAWCKEWVDTPFGDVLERMVSPLCHGRLILKFPSRRKVRQAHVSDALNRTRASGSDEQHVLQAIKEVSTTALGGLYT